MKHYVGLDLSMEAVAVCVVDGEGRVVAETTLCRNVDDIVRYLEKIDHEVELVGLESGSGSSLLTTQLLEAGVKVVCMDARALAGFLKAKYMNKNDRNDARGIAEALRLKAYKAVHPKSEAAREAKAILKIRRRLVKSWSSQKVSVRGILKEFGVRLGPAGKAGFADKVREKMEKISPDVTIAIESMLRVIEQTLAQIKALDRQIAQLAKQNPACKRLMTTPGIGPITSMSFVAEIDDITRFKDSRSVGAYIGLTPREYSSGESRRLGGISKSGSAELRSLLVEAGIVILGRCQKWSRLKAWGVRLSKRHGPKKAAVAIGRKLSVIMHRMLVTETDFIYGEPKKQKVAA